MATLFVAWADAASPMAIEFGALALEFVPRLNEPLGSIDPAATPLTLNLNDSLLVEPKY